jgi:hypothetical protein
MSDFQYQPDDDELLTDLHLAQETHTPQSRWQKARLTGDGPPFLKIGHLVRYRRRDVREWLESQPRVTSTSQLVA